MSGITTGQLQLLGVVSLALLCVGAVLGAREGYSWVTTVVTVIGALGMFACSWLGKRQSSRRR